MLVIDKGDLQSDPAVAPVSAVFSNSSARQWHKTTTFLNAIEAPMPFEGLIAWAASLTRITLPFLPHPCDESNGSFIAQFCKGQRKSLSFAKWYISFKIF